MAMNIIDLDSPHFGLGLERETSFDSFVKNKTFFQRFLWRTAEFLINRIGYMPYVFFEKDDVDERVVQKMLEHPELLTAVAEWIENADHKQIDNLRKAKNIFEKFQKPVKRDSVLYRGFKVSSGQQTHGLDRRELYQMAIGESFEDTPKKAVSFSAYQEITKAYGNVILTVDWNKEQKRMFHISNEVMVAMGMCMDGETDIGRQLDKSNGRLFSYFESVFLPDGKPLEFTLLKKD